MERVNQGQLLPPPVQPDPAEAAVDPATYTRKVEAYKANVEIYNSQQQKLKEYSDAIQRKSKEDFERHISREREELARYIPEFGDSTQVSGSFEVLHRDSREILRSTRYLREQYNGS